MIKWIFILLTFLLIGWSIKLLVSDKETIEANENNPIIQVKEEEVIRGAILDTNGKQVAVTEISEDDGSEHRTYPYGESLAHVIGYTGRGNSGLEAVFENELLTDAGLADQVAYWVTAEKSEGNSVKITIDADLQSYIYDLMDGYSGAVIITDPSTGAVKALVSSPSFDPESVVDNWETISEREDSPLYARATQGLYAPGSTFKILTALCMYRNMPDFMDYVYSCGGYYEIDDQQLYCAGGESHGSVGIQDAFAYSCNGFFASAGVSMGRNALESTAEYLKLGNDFDFELPQSESTIGLDEYESDGMVAQTSIGQGKVLLTPFNLNMITCAIANGGALYTPHLKDEVLAPDGKVLSVNQPKLWGTLMTSEEASFLQGLMQGVVEYGTGEQLYSEDYQVFGKTGTAQVEGGNDHSWFTGYVVRNGQCELVITAMIENGGYDKRAVPLVASVLDYMGY